MKDRLQKILSARGVASRRRAEEMITAGRVRVNGRAAVLGQSADPEVDEILVDGKKLPRPGDYMYIMLHKPRGIVTTLRDEKGRPNAARLVADCGCRVWPVGRLDMDSEGLLLFTNDGAFSQAIAHPRGQVDKRYLVWVRGFVPGKEVALGRRVCLDGYTIAKPSVRLMWQEGDKACLEVIIHEGRNRQVRRMCALAELQVTRLLRVAEGGLELGDLPVGTWRHLTDEELRRLRQSHVPNRQEAKKNVR